VERLRDWWMHDPGSHPRLNNCFIMNNNLFIYKKEWPKTPRWMMDGATSVHHIATTPICRRSSSTSGICKSMMMPCPAHAGMYPR
jgi:hypothetical protein